MGNIQETNELIRQKTNKLIEVILFMCKKHEIISVTS